jgi:hypothetical protein
MLCWVLAVVFEEFEVTPVVVSRARRFASEGGDVRNAASKSGTHCGCEWSVLRW